MKSGMNTKRVDSSKRWIVKEIKPFISMTLTAIRAGSYAPIQKTRLYMTLTSKEKKFGMDTMTKENRLTKSINEEKNIYLKKVVGQ